MTATAGRSADLEVAPREPGTWSGPVTSYYLLIGATALLLGIGLVMVLSSSTVDSLTATKGATAYSIFVNQARYALIAAAVGVAGQPASACGSTGPWRGR